AAAARKRLGRTDLDLLRWIVEFVYENSPMAAGGPEGDNDLFWFAVLANGLSPGSGLTVADSTGAVFRKVRRLLEAAVKRDRIPLPRAAQILAWHPASAKYVLIDDYNDDLEGMVLGGLRRLILEYGSRLRSCPAPAIRATNGQVCGKWFVARRRN